jgi:LPXTG-site transpeptidase (sortase) family protein
VLPILAPDGVLTPPSDPQELGWWADGARPGDSRGSALVTGHTVSTGGGALDNLEDLDEGDRILVHSARTVSGYAVESVETLAKGDLADRAERLFSQSVPGRLVVVTCEDWNGAEYLSNVVVTATPTTAR